MIISLVPSAWTKKEDIEKYSQQGKSPVSIVGMSVVGLLDNGDCNRVGAHLGIHGDRESGNNSESVALHVDRRFFRSGRDRD